MSLHLVLLKVKLTCLQRGQMLTPGFIDLHLHAPQVKLPLHLDCSYEAQNP